MRSTKGDVMDAKLKIAMTALRKITKVPRAEFDMTTVAKIAQTAFCDIDAIAPPVAAGSVDTPEFREVLNAVVMCKSSMQIQCNALLLEHIDAWGAQQRELGKQEALDLTVSVGKLRQRAEKAEAELERVVDLAEVVIKVLDGYHENLVPINRNSVSVSALRRQIAKFQQD